MSRWLGILGVALIAACFGLASGEPGKDGPPRVFLFDGNNLVRAKRLSDSGDAAVVASVKQLRAKADKALKAGPFSVVHPKPKQPPSGDKHDYMSMAPYFWPDPDKKDGLPYIRRDGRTNPERDKYDAPVMGRMSSNVKTLSLAYYLTGEEHYAAHATKLLRAWFLDEATYMNPHLNYAQFIPGITEGRGIGIIDTCRLLPAIESIGLLRGSPSWTKADQAGMERWFRAYLTWMQTSKLGKDEAAATNNHGSWYDVQVATYALFLGDRDTAKTVLEQCKTKRIARQIEPDGRQPRELGRTKSFGYSLYNLEALFNLATMGDQLGLDLWRYETADGRSLRKALDYLVPYGTGEKKWTAEQLGKMPYANLVPLLRRAANAYREPNYERMIARLPEKGNDETLNLLYPPRE
jgi:hypothetical protein